MDHDTATRLETLTQELGGNLLKLARRRRPALRESLQDWLMEQMTRDPVLKSRLLRFMDVVAALDFDRDGEHRQRLFREYFGGLFLHSSAFLRALFFWGRHGFMPRPLVGSISRAAIGTIAKRFIVGDDRRSVLEKLAYLERHGRYPTFALLGEEVLSEYEAEQFKSRYLQLIDCLSGNSWSGNNTDTGSPALQLSIKLTSLTENFNPADPEGTLKRLRGRLEEIARRCAAHKIGLTIDAEQFERRELTWHVFSRVFGPESDLGQWDGIGLTVQSYFRDSEEYLRNILQMADQRRVPFQIRLVKGAYWEYEVIMARHNGWTVPVFEQKHETDHTFQSMLGMLIEHSRHITIAVASHNIRDHAYAEALREIYGLPSGTIEHQTLFRTDEGISQAFRRMGWESRDYVPCGGLVPGMDYLVRRIQENTSPVGFLRRRRMRKPATELLRPPETSGSSGVVTDAGESTDGFRNNPPKRLFIAGERTTFESALTIAVTQWRQEYYLKLGSQTVKTQEIKPSFSPSRPDPQQPVGLVHLGGVEEAERAIDVAQQGFARWSARPMEERSRVLTRAAGLLGKERDHLAAWIVHEGGRTWGEALADVDEAVDH
ncbi:MAG: bifunctional proline dehydrogenase/L-glutamate gamma-semialdehyde dehydrogenase, partial [Chloroflexi bacterium]|nr:bifunctional proline dehydrogenase/L-glutamate gamma-semialdehyde dehydrogenase [Chloroflexota bacterium]